MSWQLHAVALSHMHREKSKQPQQYYTIHYPNQMLVFVRHITTSYHDPFMVKWFSQRMWGKEPQFQSLTVQWHVQTVTTHWTTRYRGQGMSHYVIPQVAVHEKAIGHGFNLSNNNSIVKSCAWKQTTWLHICHQYEERISNPVEFAWYWMIYEGVWISAMHSGNQPCSQLSTRPLDFPNL